MELFVIILWGLTFTLAYYEGKRRGREESLHNKFPQEGYYAIPKIKNEDKIVNGTAYVTQNGNEWVIDIKDAPISIGTMAHLSFKASSYYADEFIKVMPFDENNRVPLKKADYVFMIKINSDNGSEYLFHNCILKEVKYGSNNDGLANINFCADYAEEYIA